MDAKSKGHWEQCEIRLLSLSNIINLKVEALNLPDTQRNPTLSADLWWICRAVAAFKA